MRRRPPTIAALLVVVALLASGCFLKKDPPGPDDVASAFLTAWAGGDDPTAAAQTDNPDGTATTLQQLRKGLGDGARLTATPGAVTEQDGTHATVAYTADWTLPGSDQHWRYDATLPVVKAGDDWRVRWAPSDLHPGLTAASVQKVTVSHPLPARAALQDAAGTPLFASTDVVAVGVQPGKVTDLTALAAKLAAVLKIDAADIVADVTKAKPDAFVPVITLRKTDYLKVKPQIYDLAGTVFQSSTQLLAPSRTFAQPLLGRVGAATADVLKELGPGYDGSAQLGTSGLQRALNKQLAGTPGLTVKAGPTTLATLPGTPGTAVRTTLDRSVQSAADAAVATVPQAAALVAIRPSTGAILAVSDNDKVAFEIGLGGKFPAGSTFKIVTATALLDAKVVQPASTVACPGTVVVYGKEFENENKFDLGQVPLRTAFAKSCNTTFTGLSQKLDDGALPAAAKDYGVGTEWKLTAPSFGGSVPAPKDDTEKAATAIGQGRVEVNALTMALIAAQVQQGGPVVPQLIQGAEPAGETPAGPPAAVLPALRDMMRAVVTDGTATLLDGVPGGPVAGKTGTAEFGTKVPPDSHAWFTGFQGDLAFAVFVQDGQSSGTTAVPVAKAFLAGLG
ncbi:MAG TPA: penicillin-binding transpeptidase domain-containing protein [Mycobacteriales bacterium]|nr:penicillin-binding transpeptidase domain-containing protein [Mycobacteriales bacterium]